MLDRKKTENMGSEGRLPAMAPLANPYVPFQLDNPPRYETGMAFVRGTLFPGLDLPFMGMVNKNDMPNTPLSELQMLSFAIQELALYLDTHRDDQEAFALYRQFQMLYDKAKDIYEKEYGPLTHKSAVGDCYRWLCDPWPWEYPKNREV